MAKEMSIYHQISLFFLFFMCPKCLSINKLAKTRNYSIIFYLNYHVFHNQISRKMIGNAKEKNGLYYLDAKKKETPQAYQIKGVGKKREP